MLLIGKNIRSLPGGDVKVRLCMYPFQKIHCVWDDVPIPDATCCGHFANLDRFSIKNVGTVSRIRTRAPIIMRVQQVGRKSEMCIVQSRWFHLATFSALLIACAFTASVHARSVGHGSEDPWNSEHISQLPPEVREAVMRLCGHSPLAAHYFTTYSQNSRLIKLHFEHFRCEGHPSFCNQSGCLHQEYILKDGRYRLLRSFYGQGND